MTAPDRGATYQIALASTGSSTHYAWCPVREAARDPFRTFGPAPKIAIPATPELSRPGYYATQTPEKRPGEVNIALPDED
jgi:hypothetical protein